jgi:hypothetical protein
MQARKSAAEVMRTRARSGRGRRAAGARRGVRASCAAACALAAAAGPVSTPARAAAGAGAAATPLFGVTIDEISQLQAITASLAALPRRPTTRVYFDVHEPASYYAHAVQEVHAVSGVMGELLDSSDETAITTSALQARAHEYLSALGGSVDVWEIGNEVNGNWTGEYAVVSEKLSAAFQVVNAAGAQTALTLYANNFGPNNCGDGPGELTPVQFSERWVPANVAASVNYVLLSYYPTQCHGREPSPSELSSCLVALHRLYPQAALGFGEVGLPRRVRRGSVRKAEQVMRWAYSLNPGLPYYVGGYFWWYGAEDALRPPAPLWGGLNAAFEAEFAALG